jgi:hypothetical protein
VRLFGFIAVMALFLAACAQSPERTPTRAPVTTSAGAAVAIDPAKIRRLRGELPRDYEVSDSSAPAGPAGVWGLGPDGVADPPQCAALANPVAEGPVVQGISGSGPGGIVYAIVTGPLPAPVTLDPSVVADCARWTLASGHTTATVNLVDAPAIEAVQTVGMASTVKNVVEGGTETDSQAHTFTAYLGDYVTFVAVVTDPGSPNPPLGPDFAAALLGKTVSALRG